MDIEIALNVTTAILFMGILGLLLSSMLVFANKKLWVFEDPRIDDLEGMLPATNCGACGSAGCRPFAEALISGEVTPAQCIVSNAVPIEEISDYLGVESGDVAKRVARLTC
ncbi:MAG: (Fe-S)-binding protein, partial [Candidatus Thiodiazotropha taylori]